MNKLILMSALMVVCSGTDLYGPTILKSAPIVELAAPAITSYSYETRQVHPAQTITYAAAPLHAPLAAPLTLHSAPLAAPLAYAAPLGSHTLLSSKLLSAPLGVPALLSAPLASHTLLSGPTLLGKTLLIKK